MNDAVTQDTLFPDPLGVRLRLAREQSGLTIEQVGAQLKLPVAVVEAMEREDWPRLGAAIYVRSYVGSYLRLLGLPDSLLEQATSGSVRATPPLVTLASRSRLRHRLDTSLRNVVYLVMTAVLVVPVVLVARHYQSRDRAPELALDPAAAERAVAEALPARIERVPAATTAATPPPADAGDTVVAAMPAAPTAASAATGPDPVMASMTPFPKAVEGRGLVLAFEAESWVDIVAPDGTRVERGLVPAGTERRFEAGQVGHVTLGNADGVSVSFAGRTIDLAPYRTANVARFAVSSDGAPAPADD